MSDISTVELTYTEADLKLVLAAQEKEQERTIKASLTLQFQQKHQDELEVLSKTIKELELKALKETKIRQMLSERAPASDELYNKIAKLESVTLKLEGDLAASKDETKAVEQQLGESRMYAASLSSKLDDEMESAKESGDLEKALQSEITGLHAELASRDVVLEKCKSHVRTLKQELVVSNKNVIRLEGEVSNLTIIAERNKVFADKYESLLEVHNSMVGGHKQEMEKMKSIHSKAAEKLKSKPVVVESAPVLVENPRTIAKLEAQLKTVKAELETEKKTVKTLQREKTELINKHERIIQKRDEKHSSGLTQTMELCETKLLENHNVALGAASFADTRFSALLCVIGELFPDVTKYAESFETNEAQRRDLFSRVFDMCGTRKIPDDKLNNLVVFTRMALAVRNGPQVSAKSAKKAAAKLMLEC